jgi:hypothetical protein
MTPDVDQSYRPSAVPSTPPELALAARSRQPDHDSDPENKVLHYEDYDNLCTPDAEYSSIYDSAEDEHDFPDPLDLPFTDSGYASRQPVRRNPATAQNSGGASSDSKTVISDATTVIPAAAQQTISEVCNDIYNRMQLHIERDNRDIFLDTLPDLIKAFAIRLAHLDSGETNRKILHFVYSRHR